ncbi:MAG: ABC transporter permease [Mariprofundaceae bacterium]
MLLAMAWRNIVRNLRRSLITVSAIAFGLASLLFLWGFNDGAHNSMMRNLQQVIVGSIQIHAKDFFRHPKLIRTVPDMGKVNQQLSQMGEIRRTARLRTFALAAGEENSEGLIMLGISPETEPMATRLHTKVSRGRFLRLDDSQACVMGATTARNLGVHLDDEVVLLAEDRFGSLAADKFRLVGIIESGEMGIDRGLAIVPLGFMQTLLGMEGRISEIVIQLPREELEQTTRMLRDALGNSRYEVLRWYDMYPMMKQWVELENAFYYIFLTIVLVIVAAGVMNTVLMSTLERVHEFGVMMALGCGRLRLACMVAIESVLIGAIGIGVGTLLGMALVLFFNRVGIDLSAQMDTVTRFYIDPVIRTEIDLDHLLTTILAVLAAALFAAIVPAVRASRLEPVEAIHHV